MAADKTLIRKGRHRCCLSGRVQKCNLLAKRNTEDHASCHRAEARCHTRLVASNADCKKSRAAGSGILTGPSIRVRGWSRLELETLARGVCGSAADRNCSVEQAGSDDESHHLAHGDGLTRRRPGAQVGEEGLHLEGRRLSQKSQRSCQKVFKSPSGACYGFLERLCTSKQASNCVLVTRL